MKTRHNLCNLWEDFLLRQPLQHFHLSSDVLPCRQWKCDNKWYVNFAVTFSYPIGHKKCDKQKDKHFLYIYLVYFDHTCWVVVHGDCYVTVILYLHTTPAYLSPWNSTCYIMITWTAAQQVWWSYLLSRGPWLLLRNIYIKPQSVPALQNACYVTITMDHPSTSTIDNFTRGEIEPNIGKTWKHSKNTKAQKNWNFEILWVGVFRSLVQSDL